jgi:hypothetical protein
MTAQRRSPVQLALVIDTSGSMAVPIQMEFDLEGANLRDVARAVLAAGVSGRRKIDLVKAAAERPAGALGRLDHPPCEYVRVPGQGSRRRAPHRSRRGGDGTARPAGRGAGW